MSSEQLVARIIDNALTVAREKSDAADAAADAASGTFDRFEQNRLPDATGFGAGSGDISVGVVQPVRVNIPMNATGVDGALYNSTYNDIVQDLSRKFSEFFDAYFPSDGGAVVSAQAWIRKALADGGTGIRSHVEDQIWQRERARTLRAAQAACEQVLTAFAARGFSIPPGAAAHQISMAEQAAFEKIAESSRERAIEQAKMEIENIKYAVQQALDYRVKGIQAAADYIKTLAIGPQIAMQLATSAADAQSKLINAATGYYNANISVAEMTTRANIAKADNVVRASIATASNRTEATKANSSLATQRMVSSASTLASLAQSYGTQAASALNAIHASAGIAVQGEAD